MAVSKTRKCPVCRGFGVCEDGSTCPACKGVGEIPHTQNKLPEPCRLTGD